MTSRETTRIIAGQRRGVTRDLRSYMMINNMNSPGPRLVRAVLIKMLPPPLMMMNNDE